MVRISRLFSKFLGSRNPLARSKPCNRRSLLSFERLEDRTVPSVVLSVTGFPSPVTAGTLGSVIVTAKDSATGNVLTNYSGTVHFSSTDYLSALSADYTF